MYTHVYNICIYIRAYILHTKSRIYYIYVYIYIIYEMVQRKNPSLISPLATPCPVPPHPSRPAGGAGVGDGLRQPAVTPGSAAVTPNYAPAYGVM